MLSALLGLVAGQLCLEAEAPPRAYRLSRDALRWPDGGLEAVRSQGPLRDHTDLRYEPRYASLPKSRKRQEEADRTSVTPEALGVDVAAAP